MSSISFNDFRNPLHILAQQGDVEGIEKVLKKGKIDLNAKDGSNLQTALHVACYEGKFDAAYILVSNGADIHARDRQEWTPLHCAAIQDHLKVCSMLLTWGADPNAKNSQETSPLHYIIRSPYREELIEVLDSMIEHGVNLECKNKFGETPLIQAAAKGLTESVRFLLDHHSNVHTANEFNQTALHFAVGNGNRDTILLLLQYGADPHFKSQNGTAVEIAKREHKDDIAEMLEVNVLDGSTYTSFQGKEDLISTVPAPFCRVEHHMKFVTKESEESLLSDKSLSPSSSLASMEDLSAFKDMTVVKPSSKPIVNLYPGFRLELGKPNSSKERKLLFPACNYKNWFYHAEHVNFVGRVNRKGFTDKYEPIIVSILPETSQNRYRIIIWSRLGDFQVFFFPPQSLKTPKFKNGLPSEFLKFIKQQILETRPKDKDIDLELDYEKDLVPLKDRLLEFETGDPLRAKCFSVGVLYSKDGQNNEQEQFANENGGPVFEDFLSWLGDKVPLKGWLGYRGDLDTKTNATGKYSIFRRWKGFEIMFHVSTLLPFSKGEEQQLARKRRIGNDIGVIVFQEGGTYTPPIRSQFLHVYYVVSPSEPVGGKKQYKVQVSAQEAVPPFGPEIPDPATISGDPDGRDFLFTKVLNGLLASLRHPALREKIWCKPKESYLVNMVKQHSRKSTAEKLKEPGLF